MEISLDVRILNSVILFSDKIRTLLGSYQEDMVKGGHLSCNVLIAKSAVKRR